MTHCLALCGSIQKPYVHSWGSNACEQLGRNTSHIAFNPPQAIKHLELHTITSIEAHNQCSAAITASNELLMWGLCTLDDTNHKEPLRWKPREDTSQLKSISFSRKMTVCVTESKIHAWLTPRTNLGWAQKSRHWESHPAPFITTTIDIDYKIRKFSFFFKLLCNQLNFFIFFLQKKVGVSQIINNSHCGSIKLQKLYSTKKIVAYLCCLLKWKNWYSPKCLK